MTRHASWATTKPDPSTGTRSGKRSGSNLAMSKADDRNAGTNPGAIGGQARKINNWMADNNWLDGKDQLVSGEMENPRDLIDPTLPAKANYRMLKERLGLKTKSDLRGAYVQADHEQQQRAKKTIGVDDD